MSHRVDDLKASGSYREAGRVAFKEGGLRSYGCHFGMKSSQAFALREFLAGFDEAQAEEAANDVAEDAHWQAAAEADLAARSA